MFQVAADREKSLLIMTFAKRVVPEELRGSEATVEALAKELPPGFRLLSDLSGLESMDPACLPHISRTMDRLNQGGVAKVVRVIPDPHKDIGLNIMSLFHYRRRIPIVTCETLAEAMEVLVE
jgi:hypothetical protein